MYIELNKEVLEKNKKKMEEEAKSVYTEGEEGYNNALVFSDDNDNPEDIFLDGGDGGLFVSFANKLGYFSVSFEIPDDIIDKLIQQKIKKAKKFKELLKYAEL